jgi:hypothetical protein
MRQARAEEATWPARRMRACFEALATCRKAQPQSTHLAAFLGLAGLLLAISDSYFETD